MSATNAMLLSAFSSVTDTADITVKSVNDAPVNTGPGAQTVNEDTALTGTTDGADGTLSQGWVLSGTDTRQVLIDNTATLPRVTFDVYMSAVHNASLLVQDDLTATIM